MQPAGRAGYRRGTCADDLRDPSGPDGSHQVGQRNLVLDHASSARTMECEQRLLGDRRKNRAAALRRGDDVPVLGHDQDVGRSELGDRAEERRLVPVDGGQVERLCQRCVGAELLESSLRARQDSGIAVVAGVLDRPEPDVLPVDPDDLARGDPCGLSFHPDVVRGHPGRVVRTGRREEDVESESRSGLHAELLVDRLEHRTGVEGEALLARQPASVSVCPDAGVDSGNEEGSRHWRHVHVLGTPTHPVGVGLQAEGPHQPVFADEDLGPFEDGPCVVAGELAQGHASRHLVRFHPRVLPLAGERVELGDEDVRGEHLAESELVVERRHLGNLPVDRGESEGVSIKAFSHRNSNHTGIVPAFVGVACL